jgi:hypothetical protein
MKNLHLFFQYANEREAIRIRRERGESPPWTTDPVLQKYFFCNVFREDDKTTVWFREHIRDAVSSSPKKSLLACAAFRWFNLVPSGEILKPHLLRGRIDYDEVLAELRRLPKVVGGAYVIKSPDGMRKAKGLLQCIQRVDRVADKLAFQAHVKQWSLQRMHEELMQFPLMGPFMAYEVVTDLRHTCVLDQADDIMTWASVGPGATRGLGLVNSGQEKQFSSGSKRDQRVMIELMKDILEQSEVLGPGSWEMREVEHTLCEFAKYIRAQQGGRVKRKYARKSI